LRIRLDSIGCRLNIGEIESMARRFAAGGHQIVTQGDRADLCVLNTCTVTATASSKSRQLIRQLRRHNPSAKIVATGCLAELEAASLETLGVDLVVGNDDKDSLPEILENRGLLETDPDDGLMSGLTGPLPAERTRGFLKVQDGCDNRCTFCIVTIARGRGRSLPAGQIIAEVRNLDALGYREVVLSGVHLGSYGHDLGHPRGLEDLVRRILGETGIQRLRLSSLEPWDLDARFFEIFSDSRVLPHVHLPLQSGCDATLARMARKTTVRGFADLVDSARDVVSDISISTDVMVGFPGETEEEFAESIAAVEDIAFSRLHIFRYSRRDGTRAAGLPNQIPGPVAQERSRRLHEIGQRLMSAFHERFLDRRLRVLWENAETHGEDLRWSGLTDNYIRVLTETGADTDLANRVTEVDLEACVPGAVLGSVPGVSRSPLVAKSRRVSGGLPVFGGS